MQYIIIMQAGSNNIVIKYVYSSGLYTRYRMFYSFMNLRVREVHSGSVPDMHGQYCSVLLCKLFLLVEPCITCGAHQSATHVAV